MKIFIFLLTLIIVISSCETNLNSSNDKIIEESTISKGTKIISYSVLGQREAFDLDSGNIVTVQGSKWDFRFVLSRDINDAYFEIITNTNVSISSLNYADIDTISKITDFSADYKIQMQYTSPSFDSIWHYVKKDFVPLIENFSFIVQTSENKFGLVSIKEIPIYIYTDQQDSTFSTELKFDWIFQKNGSRIFSVK